MIGGRRPALVVALQWYAVLGAPAAWVAQFVLGYWRTQAACAPPADGGAIHAWEAVLTVAAAAAAAGSLAAAEALRRATGRGEVPDPIGRVRFLATVGLAVGVIFLVMILLSGAGVLALEGCRR